MNSSGFNLFRGSCWTPKVMDGPNRRFWKNAGQRGCHTVIQDGNTHSSSAKTLTLLLAICVAGCDTRSGSTLDNRINSFRTCIWQLTFGEELPASVLRDKNGTPTTSWRFASDFAVTCRGSTSSKVVDLTLPWNDARLAHWRRQTPEKYCFLGNATTNVMAVVGNGTAFSGGNHRVGDLPNDLILIVEVRNTKTHWMAPGDLDIGQLAKILSYKDDCQGLRLGTSSSGFLVGFLDEKVWLLSYQTPRERLLAFCSIDSARRYNRDKLLSPFRMAPAR